jgi:hypothetical protein
MRYLVLVIALACAGCAHNLAATSLSPVCDALEEPITYNSQNAKSNIYAAPGLAPVLAERNRVGVNLNCPAYK